MCGGSKPKLPLGLDQHLYAVPYAFIGYLLNPLWIPLCYISAFLGKRTGHGQYMDLGRWLKKVTNERLDFIVKWFFGDDTFDNKDRDLCGLIITGVLTSFGTGVALLVSGHYLLALGILLTGAAKGPSYVIGWKYKDSFGKLLTKVHLEPTKIGEFFTGFFPGCVIVLTILTLLG